VGGQGGGGSLVNVLKVASKPSFDYKHQGFSEISQKSRSLDRFMGVHIPPVFILEECIHKQRLKAKTNV